MHVGIKLRRTRTSKKDANKQRWLELQQTLHYRVAMGQEGTSSTALWPPEGALYPREVPKKAHPA